MPSRQLAELAHATKKAAGDALHISVQVSDTSAARVRVNMERMVDTGADSLVLAPPWIGAFANKGFSRRYFLESLNDAPLPMGLYFTLQSAENLDLALLEELMAHPKVHFIKDSTSSPDVQELALRVKSSHPRIRVLTGYEFDVLSPIQAGYDGCLLGTGILNAKMLRSATECLLAGDIAQAKTWQDRSNAFLHDLFRSDLSLWLGGLKYALKCLGLFSSDTMHLSFPITRSDQDRIQAALEREQEFIMPEQVPQQGITHAL